MSNAEFLLTAVYAVAIFAASAAAVELSGFFPAAGRPAALRRPGSGLLINALALATLALAGTALWLGVTRLPWPAVVIAGGLAFLAAPMAFQVVPRRFWDSRGGVAAVVAITGALLLVLQRTYVW